MSSKDAPNPPPIPNPADAINAQAAANRFNVSSPFGTIRWLAPTTSMGTSGTPGPTTDDMVNQVMGNPPPTPVDTVGTGQFNSDPRRTQWEQIVELSPEMQAQFDARNRIVEALQGRVEGQGPLDFGDMDPAARSALRRLGRDVPSVQAQLGKFRPRDDMRDDVLLDAMMSRAGGKISDEEISRPAVDRLLARSEFGGDPSSVREATFMKQKMLLDKHFDREEERLEQKLANQGIPMGAEAFKEDFGEFGRSRDLSYERAALDAVMAGAAEEDRIFGRQLQATGMARGEEADEFGRGVDAKRIALDELTAALGGAQQMSASDFGRAAQARQIQSGEIADDYAREMAGGQAQLQGALSLDEAERTRTLQERQQIVNELAALLGGTQMGPVQQGGGNIDVSGPLAAQQAGANQQFNAALAGHQSDVAQQNTAMAATATVLAAFI